MTLAYALFPALAALACLTDQSLQVQLSVLNAHLVNDLSVLIRLGMFDPLETQPYLNINVSVVNSQAHQALALQAALEGVRSPVHTNFV